MLENIEPRAHGVRESSSPRLRKGPGRPTLSNDELLQKALEVFLEKGFERTTLAEITASAGVATRTVHLRYGDKMALCKAALQRAIDECIVSVERLRAAESDDLEDTLRELGQILVENLMTPAGLKLKRMINAESGRVPEIAAYIYRQGAKPTIAYLAGVLRRRTDLSPAIADAEDAAIAYLNLVVSGPPAMAVWGTVLDPAALDRQRRNFVRLFLNGLLGRESTDEGPSCSELEALETENNRLKKLLLDSTLQLAAMREGSSGSSP